MCEEFACIGGDGGSEFLDSEPYELSLRQQAIDALQDREVETPSVWGCVVYYFRQLVLLLPRTPQQLIEEYVSCCARHGTEPDILLMEQIGKFDVPNEGLRVLRLPLDNMDLQTLSAANALEALFRRLQFHVIDIADSQITDEAAEAIFDMIEYYESCIVLCISGSRQFGIRGWQALAKMLRKVTELSELQITDWPFDANHGPVLSRSLSSTNCHLTALRLQSSHLAGEPLLNLINGLRSNTSLRELDLSDNNLTWLDMESMASVIEHNSHLQILDLSNNMIGDRGVGFLVNGLIKQASKTPSSDDSPPEPLEASTSKSNQTTLAKPTTSTKVAKENTNKRGLAVLVLWNNQLTWAATGHLQRVLSVCSSLTVLNLGRNHITSGGLSSLASSRWLVSLGLQWACISADDVGNALGRIVAGNRSLRRLDLRQNRLDSAALQTILDALRENSVLSQIDLDEPSVLPASGSGASPVHHPYSQAELNEMREVMTDIQIRCQINERNAVEPTPHRKISLTCQIPPLNRSVEQVDETRKCGRLRSPAPSPAPSPVPSPAPPRTSRFSVSRVTPDRECSSSSSESLSPCVPRPSLLSAPPAVGSSRFRVIHVAEPTQITVKVPTKSSSSSSIKKSRFSVTRIYDNPPTESATKSDSKPKSYSDSDVSDRKKKKISNSKDENYSVNSNNLDSDKNDKSSESHTALDNDVSNNITNKDSPEDTFIKTEKLNENTTLNTEVSIVDNQIIQSDNNQLRVEEISNESTVTVYKEETLIESDTQVTKNDSTVDIKVQVTLRNEKDPTETKANCNQSKPVNIDHNPTNKDETIKRIEAITEDLGYLLEEIKEMTHQTLKINEPSDADSQQSSNSECDINSVNEIPQALEKIASESSLDSSDLEVSRLMCDANPSVYTSSSSSSSNTQERLTISDTTDESRVSQQKIEPPVKCDNELDRRKNAEVESSIKSCNSDLTPGDSSNLSSSISPTDSMTPVTPLDNVKSYSSLDTSASSDLQHLMLTSADSGIEYSLQQPRENVCYECTLTSGSLRDSCTTNQPISIDSDTSISNTDSSEQIANERQEQISEESSLVSMLNSSANIFASEQTSPRRASSLLDVPDCREQVSERVRKISWAASSTNSTAQKQSTEQKSDSSSKLPLHLEKLLSIFQHPSTLFSRSNQDETKKPLVNKNANPNSFWSWGSSSDQNRKNESTDYSTEDSSTVTVPDRVQTVLATENLAITGDSSSSSSDTDNTLSEIQSTPTICSSDVTEFATDVLSQDDLKTQKATFTQTSSEETLHSTQDLTRDFSNDTLIVSPQEILVTPLDSSPTMPRSTQDPPLDSANLVENYSSEHCKTVANSVHNAHNDMIHIRETERLHIIEQFEKDTNATCDISSLQAQSPQPRSNQEEQRLPFLNLEQTCHHLQCLTNCPFETTVTPVLNPACSTQARTPCDNAANLCIKHNDDEIISSSNQQSPSKRHRLKDNSSSSYCVNETENIAELVNEYADQDEIMFLESSFVPHPKKVNDLTDRDAIESTVENNKDDITTDPENIVQTLDLSTVDLIHRSCDKNIDLHNPNEYLYYSKIDEPQRKTPELVERPRSFAAVLQSSASVGRNSPEAGHSIENLPAKIVQGIKENISPENTLTASMTNTTALALELIEKQKLSGNDVLVVNMYYDTELSRHCDITEGTDSSSRPKPLYHEDIDSPKRSHDSTSLTEKQASKSDATDKVSDTSQTGNNYQDNVDIAKDALAYLIYENQDFDPCDCDNPKSEKTESLPVLAQELKEAEKHLPDTSPELITDDDNLSQAFSITDTIHSLVPERARLKRSNSLEDLSQQTDEKPHALETSETKGQKVTKSKSVKNIAFKMPETTGSAPKDIPRSRKPLGASPKSLPESFKVTSRHDCKKKKVNSLGKIARDSLLALNISEEAIADFRSSYKLTSEESLRSLSISEDANSQSSENRCRTCIRTSQESLMSLDSIPEDCKCGKDATDIPNLSQTQK